MPGAMPVEAELAKLFCNAWRYLNFAVSNQFYVMARHFDADFYRIYQALREDYPRMASFARPGFADVAHVRGLGPVGRGHLGGGVRGGIVDDEDLELVGGQGLGQYRVQRPGDSQRFDPRRSWQ